MLCVPLPIWSICPSNIFPCLSTWHFQNFTNIWLHIQIICFQTFWNLSTSQSPQLPPPPQPPQLQPSLPPVTTNVQKRSLPTNMMKSVCDLVIVLMALWYSCSTIMMTSACAIVFLALSMFFPFSLLDGIERKKPPRVVFQGTTMHVPREPRHHIRAYHINYSTKYLQYLMSGRTRSFSNIPRLLPRS